MKETYLHDMSREVIVIYLEKVIGNAPADEFHYHSRKKRASISNGLCCSYVKRFVACANYMSSSRQAWDLALDLCLSQLPQILADGRSFQHSPFFAEQLTAFQVWLNYGSEKRSPPEQLPIVLQVRNVVRPNSYP